MRKTLITLFAFLALCIPATALAAFHPGVPDGGGGTRPACNSLTKYYTWQGADGRVWVCVPVGQYGGWDWR